MCYQYKIRHAKRKESYVCLASGSYGLLGEGIQEVCALKI